MTETPEQRLAIVRAEIRARQERDRLFAGLHARDPRWAMILELEAAAFSDAPWIVVGKLIETVGTAHTTGLRIVDALVAGGWLLTERNGGDGRQRLLALSPQALQRLDQYRECVGSAGPRCAPDAGCPGHHIIAATAAPGSGRRPEKAATRPVLDAPAVAPAGVSAPQGRPSRRSAEEPSGARGRKPETVSP